MPRPKPKAPVKREWIVTMRCVVRKTVTLKDCTEEQARESPWDFAFCENEIDQIDWTVEKVEAND